MMSTHKTRAEAEMRKIQMRNLAQDSARYRRAHNFLTDLRNKWRNKEITNQQYSTIRGQATSGDLDGAVKRLAECQAEAPAHRLGGAETRHPRQRGDGAKQGLAKVIMDNLNRRNRV